MGLFRTILTDKGRQLEAAAAAAGVQIVLTHMAVGDGNGNPVTPDAAATFLGRERFRSTLNRLEADAAVPGRFEAELVIPSSEGGFTLREVGLFTADGDLFAIANTPEVYKPTADEGAYSDTVLKMKFEVANASVVTLVLDPNVTIATRAWVGNNVTRASLIPGGLTNQVLAKRSNADGDTEWVDPTAAVEVLVYSLEEIQTLAANQVQIDLVSRTTTGCAVYVNGDRLRADQFTINSLTRLTLATSYAAGSKVSIVQNEEVGKTEILLRTNNLSDIADAAVARANLGIPAAIGTAIAGATIQWSQLATVPAFASRWPTYAEVTDKPTSYPPSAHNQDWSTIDNKPAFATRWPTYAEVTGKPALYPPADHTHGIAQVTGLQGALDGKAPSAHTHTAAQISDFTAAVNALIDAKLVNYLPKANPTFTGVMTGPAYNET